MEKSVQTETVIEESDIDNMVMAKYPVDPDEEGCAFLRNLRNAARHDYKLKLLRKMYEQKAKNDIQPGSS